MTTDQDLAVLSAVVAAGQQLWTTYHQAKSGHITPEQALTQIEAAISSLTAAVALDDKAADAALVKKFGVDPRD